MMSFEEAKMAKSAYTADILSRPNVVGLGIGYKVRGKRVTDELSVVVLVRQKVPPVSLLAAEMIPQEVVGVRTDVVEVGNLRPLEDRTSRLRPAPGGVSIGHYQITAGTLGCAVRDQQTGVRLILSNNHVLANRNDANPGDPILQPGPADGGTTDKDVIALLERFEPIYYNQEPAVCQIAQMYVSLGNTLARWSGSQHRLKAFQFRPFANNQIDAALARPILDGDIADEILEIGEVTGFTDAALGMEVMKSGRTTALTNGTINIMDTTVTVNYGGDRSATFDHQIVSSPMSEGGDSGSLLVASETKQAVGLLFAGSNQATLFNPIQAVLKILNIELGTITTKSISSRRAELEKAQAVKAAYQDLLMSKPNVVGVGIGPRYKGGRRTEEIGLVVMVQQKLPNTMLTPEDTIPTQLEGIPVDVREVGTIEAQ
jgi:hypothetical protein